MNFKSIRYALEAALVYALYGFFRLLPVDMASACGGRIMRLVGPHTRFSRIARINLDIAFPGKSPAEKEAIEHGMWDNLGRIVGEYPHLDSIAARVELVGFENLVQGTQNGGLVFGGHFANWEIPVQKEGLRLNLVYRTPNNPRVDRLLRRIRGPGYAEQIRKGAQGARAIIEVLRDKGVIGMLVDQKMNDGTPIPFFGIDAMTAPAIAHFALKFGCPVYPVHAERLGGCRFKVTALPPLPITPTGNREEDTKRILTDINLLLESWIRQRPEQWLWIHRRWPKNLYEMKPSAT